MTQNTEPTGNNNNAEKKPDAIDHDRIFKELIGTFTIEFLQTFLPEVLKYLDTKSLVPLDKEIFTDVTAGEKHEVDLILRARFKPHPPKKEYEEEAKKTATEFEKLDEDAKSIATESEQSIEEVESGEYETLQPSEEAYFVIHIEAQSTYRRSFPLRMFIYYSRLLEKYNQPVYPIVVFSFDSPLYKVARGLEVKFPDRPVVQFDYVSIQLNQLDWKNFVNNPNPIASALMAKMKIAPEDRPTVKLECLKMLVGLKLDPARSQLITGFINTYLKLDQKQKQEFETKLEKFQPTEKKEEIMQVMNEWIEQGIVRGRQEGHLDIVLRQLHRKFGQLLSTSNESQVKALTEDKLSNLADALLDFTSLQDLNNWFNQNTVS